MYSKEIQLYGGFTYKQAARTNSRFPNQIFESARTIKISIYTVKKIPLSRLKTTVLRLRWTLRCIVQSQRSLHTSRLCDHSWTLCLYRCLFVVCFKRGQKKKPMLFKKVCGTKGHRHRKYRRHFQHVSPVHYTHALEDFSGFLLLHVFLAVNQEGFLVIFPVLYDAALLLPHKLLPIHT